MPRFYTSDLFKESDGWERFRDAFIAYKALGILPDVYGKDTPLRQRPLHHIHLASDADTVKRWARIPPERQSLRKIRLGNDDYWLIYAHDDCEDAFLLLAIMGPEAHNDHRWNGFLNDVQHLIVKPWLEGRVVYKAEHLDA